MADTVNTPLREALHSVLADCTLSRGSEEFKQANSSYFSAFANELTPAYIVQPSSPEQVTSLVHALRPHLLTGDCRIAVRGTGHTPFASSANIQDGITVDLRGLKGIFVDEDKSNVEIAVGETWESVYTELEKHDLTVAGARDARIGVGGFILGGGLSIHSSKLGFACDSVTEFKIVLSSGELARANSSENPGLWWALKGGLNNFGIVTSFKMKTLKSGSIWGGVTYYMPEAFPNLLERACDFVNNETDSDTHVMCSAGYGFGHQAATCIMYHTRGIENAPSLQRFTSLGPQIEQMNTMRVSTQLGFSEELAKFSTSGKRQFWTSLTIKPDVSLMEAFYARWQETLDQVKDADGFIFSFGFHPLTKSLLESSAKAGGNAMAIPALDGPLFVALINPIWSSTSDDGRILAAVEKLVTDLRQMAEKKGLLHRYIFTNYGFQNDDVIVGYGAESSQRLRETSARYDPDGIFQKGVPGGFKLSSKRL
ncbi:FAD-binding domain-containing protein [Apiospora kogelbergensis]|uniref:FAD-binding domain-containing protein n=1 Tax=Apiospora kogelbergensis TaxID=1337665 RepID=UPI003131F819